jgi:hypothetical protein
MSTFVFVYRTPKDYVGSPDAIAVWNAWFDSLGGGLVDRGNPVFTREVVGVSGDATMLGGYSLVTADDMEAAVGLAKGCPAMEDGGGVEVGELTILHAGTQFAGSA